MLELFSQPSWAEFNISALSSTAQITMAELGIDGKVASEPGVSVGLGYVYRKGGKGSSSPGGSRGTAGRGQQGLLALSLDYAMKTLTFLNQDTGERTIAQQPSALNSIEGRISINDKRLYAGLIIASKDYSFVESISVTEINLAFAPILQTGVELGVRFNPSRKYDIEMAFYGLQTAGRKVGQLKLNSGDSVGAKVSMRFFARRWFELIGSTERSSFNFTDSKQTSLQAGVGIGIRF
ncbi:MAG: hypothetical protein SGJ18_10660 [Pseudomonadota bacterium]|nr:hypothetical protein [Pseudomonadota bacterium]